MEEKEKKVVVLLPCPFCGGKGELRNSFTHCQGYTLTTAFIMCSDCGAKGPSYDDYCTDIDLSDVFKAWNYRRRFNK